MTEESKILLQKFVKQSLQAVGILGALREDAIEPAKSLAGHAMDNFAVALANAVTDPEAKEIILPMLGEAEADLKKMLMELVK